MLFLTLDTAATASDTHSSVYDTLSSARFRAKHPSIHSGRRVRRIDVRQQVWLRLASKVFSGFTVHSHGSVVNLVQQFYDDWK